MQITKEMMDKAEKVATPKNTASPFHDFYSVLPAKATTNTLYKVNDNVFLYIPNDKRYKIIRTIHVLKRIPSKTLIGTLAFDDITINVDNKITRKTIYVTLKKPN
ncbi:MAG TPA: hypothetical protein VEA58_08835 [Anaerovoracaceae bacterium]|nr:hypothetical protein [Anaerovoracaceae bacterium]